MGYIASSYGMGIGCDGAMERGVVVLVCASCSVGVPTVKTLHPYLS